MSEQEPRRKKGGRPRKHSPDAKRPTMAFRINSSTHARLIEAAAENERSLSEEIEWRIDQSFTQPDIIKATSSAAAEAAMAATINFVQGIFGGEDRMSFGKSMASALSYAMHAEGAAKMSYKELVNHPEKLKFVQEYLESCVRHELLGKVTWTGSEQWPIGIRHNLATGYRLQDDNHENEPPKKP